MDILFTMHIIFRLKHLLLNSRCFNDVQWTMHSRRINYSSSIYSRRIDYTSTISWQTYLLNQCINLLYRCIYRFIISMHLYVISKHLYGCIKCIYYLIVHYRCIKCIYYLRVDASDQLIVYAYNNLHIVMNIDKLINTYDIHRYQYV